MRCAGIDIGSRTIELVVVEGSEIIACRQTDTGYDPIAQAKKLLNGISYDRIIATGYGRNLFKIEFDTPTVTEIKAYAKGIKALFPEAQTVLDIGGQDSKAITLYESGKIRKFEMNDRCAAGTGKFLEIMAKTLGFNIEEFGNKALNAKRNIQINTMCTVFAESEVTSLISKGECRAEIARGLHASVAKRAVSMLKRLSSEGMIVFAGGVAKNVCLRYLLAESLGRDIYVPKDPQSVGAYGASLIARENL